MLKIDKDLLKDINFEDLDFTLVDRYQKFLFLNVDDYSVAIAKLLLKYRPDKKFIVGGGGMKTKCFAEDSKVKYLSRLYDAGRHMELTEEWMRGAGSTALLDRIRAFIGWKILATLRKCGDYCIVKVDRRNHPGEEGLVYNSQNVMRSLMWKKQKRCFGEKNPDKEIVIIDYSCDKEGLGSIARCAFAHIMWMRENGYVPVMNLHTYPNQYLNDPGENMWEYFFEPVSQVTVDEAYESKNVIIATENDISWHDVEINPYQRVYMKEFANNESFRKTVRFNSETRQYVDAKMPKEIREGKRVLGVVMRGSDFRKEVAEKYHKEWRKNVVDPDLFLQACSYYMDKLKCEYIFLATEDAEYLQMAQKVLGDKVLFIDQKRTTYDYANKENIALNEAMEQNDGRIAGRDYLSVIHSLTECRALLYNVKCGAVRLAWMWKPERYEIFQGITGNWKEENG